LIAHGGKYLLLDPYLSDSLTRKYAATDKPHDRLSALAIEPHALDFVDVVTSSHNHTDHLDAETLSPLFEANPICSSSAARSESCVRSESGWTRLKVLGWDGLTTARRLRRRFTITASRRRTTN
jgi:L-ascorbate metabolism protein UlaG (beta-lactamase superfamily)